MPRKTPTTTAANGSPGIIEPGAIYTKQEFLARAGLSNDAYLRAVRQGLRVIHRHKRAYVRGDDWAEYLARET